MLEDGIKGDEMQEEKMEKEQLIWSTKMRDLEGNNESL